jgi:glucosylglycerate phosphorylase
MMSAIERIRQQLAFIYGEEVAQSLWPQLNEILDNFHKQFSEKQGIRPSGRLSQRDAILITYGDQIQAPDRPPLQALAEFLESYLQDAISGVHILPFFPYSSDDGFSVIDYRKVNPVMGSWQDIDRLESNFRLMFDAVINHISRESEWFQGYLRNEAPFSAYFITISPDTDLSMVVRPRALPLLTRVETLEGPRHVWTTFSDDQIDLNYANPQVLLEIVDLLLFYVIHGAEIIRLDAIAYLWKEVGTPCIHLPETHAVVKLFRAVLDAVAPGVLLITETNVPHEENISYYGEVLPERGRTDEAQLVYQFPLAPLVLHSFIQGSARVLSRWAAGLNAPGPFFNFIASHDGIGLMPARGLLEEAEIQALIDRTQEHGGQVSYKTNQDGSRSVYELNISLYDMLNDPQKPNLEIDVRRFLASQAIMLSLAGVPGIYVHSLFGSHNCQTCLERTGRARSINREKFKKADLISALKAPGSQIASVFAGYRQLLLRRKEHLAFHPQGEQRLLIEEDGPLGETVFGLVRSAPDESERIVCLVNVSGEMQEALLDLKTQTLPKVDVWRDLVSGKTYTSGATGVSIPLKAYEYVWLCPEVS